MLATLTRTCILTTTAYLFGGTNQDEFVDAVIDTSGNVFVAGNTYSPTYTNGEQDVAMFRFSSSGTLAWGIYWGSS